jgi:hypothetical protein
MALAVLAGPWQIADFGIWIGFAVGKFKDASSR